MEADSYRRSKPLLPVVTRQVAQLLDLYLVRLEHTEKLWKLFNLFKSHLPLVDVRETWIPVLGCNASRGGEDVLEPIAFGWMDDFYRFGWVDDIYHLDE